jgi:hypothetical protein
MSRHPVLRVAHNRGGRAVALLTALAVALGLSLSTALPAHAAGGVLRTPLEQAPGTSSLLAYWGPGAAAWADLDGDIYTSTGGNWTKSRYVEGYAPDVVADGKLISTYTHEVRVLDIASGAATYHTVPMGEVYAANQNTAVAYLGDYEWGAFDLADTSDYVGFSPDWPDEPKGTKGMDEFYTITQNAFVDALSYYDKKGKPLGGFVVIQPLDGSASWTVKTEGSIPFVGGGSTVTYLDLDGTTLQSCEVTDVSDAPHCTTITTNADGEVSAVRFDNGVLGLIIDGTPYLWEDGNLTEIAMPDDALLQFPFGGGGDARPLVSVTTDDVTSFHTVEANGSLSQADLPDFSAVYVPDEVDLGSGWVAGLDSKGKSRAWVRARNPDGSLGEQQELSTTATGVYTSAGRTILSDSKGLVRYDQGVKQKATAKVYRVRGLSGPYALVQAKKSSKWELRSPTATLATKLSTVVGLFGSLVATADTKKQTITVTDAVTGTAITREYGPMSGDLIIGDLWGDWVGLSYEYNAGTSDNPVYTYQTVLLNYRGTSPRVEFEGYLSDVGDGYAHGGRDGVDYLWNYQTGLETVLGDDVFSWSSFSGDTLAYATASDLVLRPVSGAGGSAPRALGVLADGGCNAFACNWKLDVDATLPLPVGSLQLTGTGTAAGTTLTIPVGAAPDGSLRLSWDGLLADDSFAPAGTYTWSLDVGDGSQRLRTVDGLGTVTGTLKVTRDKVPMPAYVPGISGDAATGETLTADPGPNGAGATVTYQWYRGTKAIKGAKATTYVVTSTDVGKTLKVKVSYSGMEVYKDTSVTSKPTAKVVKGTIAEGDLSVTGAVQVDSTLTATPSGFAPMPDDWKYQWYRVNAKGKATKIKKATKATYAVTAADAGLPLKVTATGTLAGYTGVTVSVTTDPVGPAAG